MRKHRKRRVRHSGVNCFVRKLGTIYRNSVGEVTEEQQRDVLLPGFIAFDELRAGRLDAQKFVTLNQVNCMAYQMGRQVAINRKNDETADVALMAKESTEKAAEALSKIGTRWEERDRFIATGDELEAIRGSFDMCSQLLALLPSGLVLRAITDAENMIQGTLSRRRRAE